MKENSRTGLSKEKHYPVLHSLSLGALTHWGFLLQHWFSSRIPTLNFRALILFGLVLVPPWFPFSAPAASVWSPCAGHGQWHLHRKGFVFRMNSANFTPPTFNSDQTPTLKQSPNPSAICESNRNSFLEQMRFAAGLVLELGTLPLIPHPSLASTALQGLP